MLNACLSSCCLWILLPLPSFSVLIFVFFFFVYPFHFPHSPESLVANMFKENTPIIYAMWDHVVLCVCALFAFQHQPHHQLLLNHFGMYVPIFRLRISYTVSNCVNSDLIRINYPDNNNKKITNCNKYQNENRTKEHTVKRTYVKDMLNQRKCVKILCVKHFRPGINCIANEKLNNKSNATNKTSGRTVRKRKKIVKSAVCFNGVFFFSIFEMAKWRWNVQRGKHI